jgi:hypothetical protein
MGRKIVQFGGTVVNALGHGYLPLCCSMRMEQAEFAFQNGAKDQPV